MVGDQEAKRRLRWVRGGILVGLGLLLLLGAMVVDRPARGDAELPVPRFVSLKSDTVNVRQGPSLDHAILWIYKHTGLPVEIIAEHEHWRRIRDWEGEEGWVHKSLLSGRRTVMIAGEVRTLLAEPDAQAPAIARAEPGVIAALLGCAPDWCEIEVAGYRGWLPRDQMWGVYPDELYGS